MATYMSYAFPQQPQYLLRAQQVFADAPKAARSPHSNFLKGVKWSPDGACCLTAADDGGLYLFDLPPDAATAAAAATPTSPSSTTPPPLAAGAASGDLLQQGASGVGQPDSWAPALRIEEGETVYDYAWYPGMNSSDPATCCLASTSRDHPLHLYDALTGALRASYRGYNDADEPTAATSCAFTPDGAGLYAGYARALRRFDLSRPGRDCMRLDTWKKRREGALAGIVSCLAVDPVQRDLLAAGAYSGGVGLYDAHNHTQVLLLTGHTGGVTQVTFSPCGNFLYSGARQDDALYCWDVRYSQTTLYTCSRAARGSNQRLQFDLDGPGRHLATGGTDGCVRVFDLRDGSQVDCVPVSLDTVNGCSFNPAAPLLAVATGERRFPAAAATARRRAGQPSNTAQDGQQQQRQQQQPAQSSCCSSSSSSEDEAEAGPASITGGGGCGVRGMAFQSPALEEASSSSSSSRGCWQPAGPANLLLGMGLAYTLEEWPGPGEDGAGGEAAGASPTAAGSPVGATG